MKTKVNNQQGFTLIELLVVIAIIAILASVSVPALQRAQVSSRMNKSMQEAVGIAKGIKIYSDEEGLFPSGEDANEALAELFPEFGKEDPFYVPTSAWHGTGRFKSGPDNVWGEDEDGSGGSGQPLEGGENHWAYNNLAAEDSGATIPLLADGFSESVGTYSTVKSELGGVWKGKKAIVVFCDYSGKQVKLTNEKFLNTKANDRDEFARSGVEMVNPAQP